MKDFEGYPHLSVKKSFTKHEFEKNSDYLGLAVRWWKQLPSWALWRVIQTSADKSAAHTHTHSLQAKYFWGTPNLVFGCLSLFMADPVQHSCCSALISLTRDAHCSRRRDLIHKCSCGSAYEYAKWVPMRIYTKVPKSAFPVSIPHEVSHESGEVCSQQCSEKCSWKARKGFGRISSGLSSPVVRRWSSLERTTHEKQNKYSCSSVLKTLWRLFCWKWPCEW